MLQERNLWQQNAELNLKTQLTTYQESLNKKDKQTDEINSHCKQLRDNIGQLENKLRYISCFKIINVAVKFP